MTDYLNIEQLLLASFDDFKLSKKEKADLRSLLESLDDKDEMLSFTRNKAFDIYREAQVSDTQVFHDGLTWLERIIKTIDGVRTMGNVKSPSAYFSPGDVCAKQIINALLTARNSIDICVFTISDNHISDAILTAHNKGKRVRIVSDNDKANDKGSDIYLLADKGVPVRLDKSPYHMHHKFAIFDQRMLLNGSFNWTRSASEKNEENITLLYEPHLINSFSKTFDDLWNESETP